MGQYTLGTRVCDVIQQTSYDWTTT